MKNYRDKGIKVCDEWAFSYEAFQEWAESNGYTEGLTIDRIDNDGNYTPDNCRWVSQRRNARNVGHVVAVKCTDIEHDAIAYFPSLADASDITGVPKENIIGCLRGHQNTAYGFKFEEWDEPRYKRTCNIVTKPSDSDYRDGWHYLCSECGFPIEIGEAEVFADGSTPIVLSHAAFCWHCGAEVADDD